MTLCYPDYSNSILNLTASLLCYYGAATPYASLPALDAVLARRKWRHIVLLILDGMGMAQLKEHLPERSFLHRHLAAKLSSVFPSTTAAALTTLNSGLAPIAHGWLGWAPYFKELNRAVELFTNCDYYTKAPLTTPSAWEIMPYQPIECQIAKATGGRVSGYRLSPYATPAVQNVDELFHRLATLTAAEGRHFISAYWPEPDGHMHDLGTKAPEVGCLIRALEAKIAVWAEKAQETLMIITADHGQIDLKEEIYLNDYPALAACVAVPLSLEGRAASVFLKAGMRDTFINAFHESPLADDFLLLTREEVLARNLFGPGAAHPRAADFVGDVMLIAVGDREVRWRLPGIEHRPMKGVHAGLTAREMQVPLILIET